MCNKTGQQRHRLVRYVKMALRLTSYLIIPLALTCVFEVTEGVLKISADTPLFGLSLAHNGVLQPLWQAATSNFNLDLIAKQQQVFLETHLFMQNCSGEQILSAICNERFFVVLKPKQYIHYTTFDEANRPPVIWKYWLEPAELLMHVDIDFDALMISNTGRQSKQSVALSGLLEVIIRTEFSLCMIHIEYYPRGLQFSSYGTNVRSEAVPVDDMKELRRILWTEWIPKFVNEAKRIIATRDFCDQWLPPDYHNITKY